jgi:type I restriction enzyme S subunit
LARAGDLEGESGMSGYKRYPAYKESGVEWIGQIPAGWEFQRIKWSCSYRVSNVDKVASNDEVPVRLCNYTDVYHNDFINPSMNFMEATATKEEIERFGLMPDDVLITKDSESWDDIGVPALVTESEPNLVCGYHLALIRPHGSVLSGKFLFRCLQSDYVNHQFQMAANGVTRFGMPKAAVGNALIPVPIFQEQQKIAAYLDRKTAQIDRLIEIKRRQIELLKEERTAVINHAVTKGLNPGVKMKESGIEWIGEFPEGWEVKRLKLVVSDMVSGPFGSALKKEEYTSEGYRVYGQEQVIPGDFTVGDYYISEEKFKSLERYAVSSGDILVSCVGTFGKIAVVPDDIEPGVINPRLIRLAPDKTQITSLYLEQLLSSSFVFSQFEQVSRGGTMGVINLGLLSELLLPIPSIKEQPELLERIKEISRDNSKAISLQEQQIQLLQEYRTTLISDAVTGKIDVREEAA